MRRSFLLYWLVITLTACHLPALSVNLRQPVDDPSPSPQQQVVVLPSPTLTPSVQPPTATATVTPSLTPSPAPTPYGCERPPDDYTLVTVGEFTLNQRTLWMLQRAQQLYGGTHDLVRAVTQGSYSPGVSASFGTHDGGGAVDLSVRDLNDWNRILYEDLDKIILALRQAGFAAWVRWPDVLYPGSPIHIHAIAIGDAQLSPAARDQLTGPNGYFRGFNGLPVEPPQPDEYGGPYICPWMIEMGYQDLRGQP